MTLRLTVMLFFAMGASWAGPSMHNPFFCYTTDPIRSMTNMYAHFNNYEAIRRFNFTTIDPYRSSKVFPLLTKYFVANSNLLLFEACTPARFWYLGRYGGRYPQERGMENMMDIVRSTVSQKFLFFMYSF